MPLPLYQDQNQPSGLNPLANVQTIVAIAAGKGGVGKSSVTVNLGLALQAQGYQVGIMDTDIYGPSIRKMMPEDRLPLQKGTLIQPALCRGIKMISMAYFRKEDEAAAVRAPIANSLISHFIKNVQWGPLDFLLMDFPPGTGDVQLTLGQQAHLSGALMVTTPQEVAVLDVRKAISLFQQIKVPIIGIVENMSYYQSSEQMEPVYLFGRGGGERLAKETGTPF
jgi:ATP-binding protein involved in chromosome partitioning